MQIPLQSSRMVLHRCGRWTVSAAAMSMILLMLSVYTAAASLAAETCDATSTSTAKPPTNQVQLDIFSEKIKHIDPSSNVVFVGDSLVQFWPDEKMRSAARSSKVFNFGVGLDRTQHVLWRLDADQLDRLRPRSVYVLVGTNNLRAGDTVCAIASGIEAVLNRIKELWPRSHQTVILIPPRGDDFRYRNEDRLQINAIVKADGDRTRQWDSLDVDAILSCNLTNPCQNYLPDYVHFSETGYKVLSEIVRSDKVH